MDGETLPPPPPPAEVPRKAVWNVKDFPVYLRTLITHAAQEQHCTVAEWLTAYFHKHNFEGVEVPRARVTVIRQPANPPPALPAPTALDELQRLATLARDLSPPDKDTAVLKLARAAVRNRLKVLMV